MTAYTKSTNFATKDTLTSGDPLKIVKGTEINTEFDNIATAVNSKSDTASPTFTGTVTIPILAVTGASTLTGVATLTAQPILSSLTASSAVATDASKGLVSVTNTGTGNNVLATSPTLVTPILGTPTSGTVTNLTGTASININGTVGATTANTGAFTTLSATGVTTVQAGTAALPAITTTGDTNTGIFFPAADTIAFTEGGVECARFDSSASLLVGTTDSTKGALTVGQVAPSSAYGQICALSPTAADTDISGMSIVKYANNSTTAQVLFRFLINQGGAGQGQINGNGANAAAFGSYSDARLKENIVDLPSQLSNIMALRPVEFDYIESEGGGHQIGFVAQEVKEIYPDLVGEDADGMYTLSDMNKNDARLIKAIQEMKAIIDTQATTITALTARITALEAK